MFKVYKCEETIVHEKRVFDMKSVRNIDGLVMLIPTCLSLENTKFVESMKTSVERIPADIRFRACFIAFFNTVHKKILIVKNRYTGDTGVFDYEL